MTRQVPVRFVRMCCMSGAVAGQASNGGVYYRDVRWLSDAPWLYMPPPTISVSVTTKKVKPARRGIRR